MCKRLFAIFWVFILFFQSLFVTLPAYAQTAVENTPAVNANEAAVGKPNVVFLGEKIDKKTGKKIQGYMFIHRKHEKRAQLMSEGAITSAANSACYAFTVAGAKWKTSEGFIVNPANTRGVDTGFVVANHGVNIAKWEDASTGAIDSSSQNIVGDLTVTNNPLSVDLTSPDNQNEVYFGQPSVAGAIAATTVWGYFGGPESQREIIEADVVFNDVDYDWSANGEAAKMDFENISTHELGHVMGLADIYDFNCSAVTMYGYSDVGDISKRTLEVPDVTGVSTLYGQPPVDTDGDGIFDISDNCPTTPNSSQTDTDGDGVGDLCDTDLDGDGVTNTTDNCPSVPNANQTDADNDGIGDACDFDYDNDGVLNSVDNCLNIYNPAQANFNSEITDLGALITYDDATNPIADNIGDACDADMDHDRLSNSQEASLGTDPMNPDSDGDRNLDGAEVICGSNPQNATSTVIKPLGINLPDADGDKLPDSCEAAAGTNPNDIDTDDDKLFDGNEFIFKGTNPNSLDTDGDSCSDAREVASVNGDRSVNVIDLQQIAQRVNAYHAHFDFDGSGTINVIDLQQVAALTGSC